MTGTCIGGDPASARRDFSRSKPAVRREEERERDSARGGINKRETLYKTSPPEVARDSPSCPGAISTFRLPPLPFPPVLQPAAHPFPQSSSHSSGRQPTFPTSPERGHYGVTRRNTFPASSVIFVLFVCARTERRVTQAAVGRDPRLDSKYANVVHTRFNAGGPNDLRK